jgi:thiamine-monophosphate kinase
MIDVSDGLLADLGHIADSSGVLIDVASAALGPGEPLLAAARAVQGARRHADLARTDRGSPPKPADSPQSEALRWVLSGGEDHSLVATFPPGAELPSRWKVIGAVRPGQGVLVHGQPWAGARGWDHFTDRG